MTAQKKQVAWSNVRGEFNSLLHNGGKLLTSPQRFSYDISKQWSQGCQIIWQKILTFPYIERGERFKILVNSKSPLCLKD